MIKFLFAPFGGRLADLNFFETYLSCVAGAIFSAAIFYYSSEFFLKRARQKRHDLHASGKVEETPKRKFTRMNKFVVRIKRRFGIVGVSMYAPLFLSVPIGSIIAAKFYGKDRRTFLLIVLGMVVNGLITTGIHYGSSYLF